MQILDLGVRLSAAHQSDDTSLFARFASDYFEGRLLIAHKHLKAQSEVMTKEWEVLCFLIFGRDSAGSLTTDIELYPSETVRDLTDVSFHFFKYLDKLISEEVKEPDESVAATYGGVIICSHEAGIEVIGLYPIDLDIHDGLTWHRECFNSQFPHFMHAPLLDQEATKIVEGILDQALHPKHEAPPASLPTSGQREKQVSTKAPRRGENIFHHLRSEIRNERLPPHKLLFFREYLKYANIGTMRVLTATAEAPNIWTMNKDSTVIGLFLVAGWEGRGDAPESEADWYQQDDPMDQYHLFECQAAFSVLWANATKDCTPMFQDEEDILKGLAVMWVVIEDDQKKDVYHGYLLVNRSMKDEVALDMLRTEMNFYFKTDWE